MKSLVFRIAALLVAAIVFVVILSTVAAFFVLRPPISEDFSRVEARKLELLATLVERDRTAAISAGAVIRPQPNDGEADTEFSTVMSESLKRIGSSRSSSVVRGDESWTAIVSLQLADGNWLIAPLRGLGPPPGEWKRLLTWLALIIVGSAFIAVFAATKITRPLQLIENAMADVGADGMFAHIPETGNRELRATAQALNRLSTRLRAATESRMRLVAAAGHDLRTPMTRMRLRAEFIEDDAERGKWFADLEELDSIADSAIRLVREEVGASKPEKLRLDTAVGKIISEVSALDLKVKQGSLETITVYADPLALTRALRNLIINAATHGEAAMVTVERQAGKALVRIEDSGPGVPPDLLGQIFEPFFRIDIARRKAIPGAGLGLAIAKEIIERFNGGITVRNRVARGLEVVVALPEASDDAP
ncbi:HAMP domain-containing protein [Agrobacterium sp. a22-2]|uniref:HAMP domain-containing sensor histidine kinase n=1 Tax=Agrobacterium sp. a22-2 TaxID=2283840 RepID=UPI0014474EDF|nr:ATP-binding protein [Agrobacterium sp. a22-2]NKN34769.1 HAMP domain-containing protein [Agrobacterium sp. a22-2]